MSQPPFIRAEIPPGTLIDNRYMIQRLLGQGGLGRTYLAEDTRRFNEYCVLKEFAPSGTGEHGIEKSRNLFKREAKILHQIQHPQIPKFLACFEGDGRLFLVQEFVDGKAYSVLLRERQSQGGSFSEAEVIDWLKRLLPVLEYIHSRGIIHRDISPDNIMLPNTGKVPVLIDFGVGKQIADLSDSNGENPGFVGKMSLVGKIGYAPREQISLGRCSPSSDLYALGVTAAVLLTGRDPSHLMDQYSLEWKWRSLAEVSDRFAKILDKMLVDTPRDRYQSVQQVIADLYQLEQSLNPTPINPTFVDDDPSALGGETIVSPPENPFRLSDSEAITQPPRPTSIPPTRRSGLVPERAGGINPSFIERCQRELAFAIGPIAGFVIEEVLEREAPTSIYQLVEALEKEIPNAQEAIAFHRRLLS
jgi:serine/threonine protein kinase